MQDLKLLFKHPIYRNFNVTVRRVTITGGTATADVVLRIRGTNHREREKYSLVKEDGTWRLALRVGG